MNIHPILSPNHTAQMGELLTRCFPTPPGGRYWDDFPIWDPGLCDAPTLSRWGVSENGQLIACAGVRLADLNATGAGGTSRGTSLPPVLPVALIGAVATSEQSRGRGLASELVSHAVQWAQARGAKLALLWGSEHSLYEKLGFELKGEQWLVPIPAPSAPSGPKHPSPIYKGWTPQIFDARLKRGSGLALTERDRAWYSAHRNVHWYSTPAPVGTPGGGVSYLAWGRGMDLGGVVHEWGGTLPELRSLLRAAQADGATSVLGNPEFLNELGLAVPEDPSQAQSLALVKVLDPSAAAHPLWSKALWIWGLDAV